MTPLVHTTHQIDFDPPETSPNKPDLKLGMQISLIPTQNSASDG